MYKLLENLNILFRSEFSPKKKIIFLFIFLTLIGSFLKIFSIVSLLPLLEKITNFSSDSDNLLFRNLNLIFEYFSIEKNLAAIAFIIISLLLLKFCIDMLSIKFFEKTMVNFSLKIRKLLTNYLFKINYESFEKIKNNELISIFQEQSKRVRIFFRNSIQFITYILESLIFLFSSLLIDFFLTIFALVLGASKFLILKKIHKINQSLGVTLTEMQMEDNKSILDSLNAMKFLRFMNKEKFGINKTVKSVINLDEVGLVNHLIWVIKDNNDFNYWLDENDKVDHCKKI